MVGSRQSWSRDAKTNVHSPWQSCYRGTMDAKSDLLSQTQIEQQHIGQTRLCKYYSTRSTISRKSIIGTTFFYKLTYFSTLVKVSKYRCRNMYRIHMLNFFSYLWDMKNMCCFLDEVFSFFIWKLYRIDLKIVIFMISNDFWLPSKSALPC